MCLSTLWQCLSLCTCYEYSGLGLHSHSNQVLVAPTSGHMKRTHRGNFRQRWRGNTGDITGLLQTGNRRAGASLKPGMHPRTWEPKVCGWGCLDHDIGPSSARTNHPHPPHPALLFSPLILPAVPKSESIRRTPDAAPVCVGLLGHSTAGLEER